MSPNPGIDGNPGDDDADASCDVMRGAERLRVDCVRSVEVPADAAAAFLTMVCSFRRRKGCYSNANVHHETPQARFRQGRRRRPRQQPWLATLPVTACPQAVIPAR